MPNRRNLKLLEVILENEESANDSDSTASGEENSVINQVFSRLWQEYCNINYESGSFCIFEKVMKWKPLPGLDFSFEFTDLYDSDVILENPKDAMELWANYYNTLDKEVLINKYISQVKKYFERNAITKYGCIQNYQNRELPPMVINETCELPHINGANSLALNVSRKLKYNEADRDRAFVAAETIPEGEPLIVEMGLISCGPPSCDCLDLMYFQCYLCRAPIINPFRCPTCFVAIFCSKDCRETCRVYHIWECKAVKTHFFKHDGISLLAFRMLMIGANCNFDINQEYYSAINNLPADISAFSNPQKKLLVRKCLQILIYLTNHTTFYKWMERNSILKDIEGIENKNLFLGGTLIRHLIQAISNVVYFPFEDYSLFFQTKGAVFTVPTLCPMVVKIKQDCHPNAKLMFKRNFCIVKALRKIEKGDTITVNMYQCDEFEVHNTKKMFFSERKMTCDCRKCLQPYNKLYGEVLLRCKICSGIAGKVGEQWQCFQCKNLLKMEYMDNRKKLMEAKYMALQRNRFINVKSMMDFLVEYPTVYCAISLEYLEVCTQCCKTLLYGFKYSSFINVLDGVLELLNLMFDKYSMLRMHVIAKLVNCILVFNRVMDPTTKLSSILYTCSKDLEEVCSFYCLTSQWKMLHKMVWNIGFIAMKPSKEEIEMLKSLNGRVLSEDSSEAERAYAKKINEVGKLALEHTMNLENVMAEVVCILIDNWFDIQWDLLPSKN